MIGEMCLPIPWVTAILCASTLHLPGCLYQIKSELAFESLLKSRIISFASLLSSSLLSPSIISSIHASIINSISNSSTSYHRDTHPLPTSQLSVP